MTMHNSLTYKECIDLLDSNEVLRKNMHALPIAYELEFVLGNLPYYDTDEEFESLLTEEEKDEIFRLTVDNYLDLEDDCSYYIIVRDTIIKWINRILNKEDDPFDEDEIDGACETFIKFRKGEE